MAEEGRRKRTAERPDAKSPENGRPYYSEDRTEPVLKEPLPAYSREREERFTVEDYRRLPETVRTELIDGVFYDMASPSWQHQRIVLGVAMQLMECEKKHDGRCRVVTAPFDVQLDADEYTMLQPDVLVICDPEKLQEGICVGAPDLIVEVVSPSSRTHDMLRKRNKYEKAGVREYWIVDPDEKSVTVYLFRKEKAGGGEERTYRFTDTVPVTVSEGACSVSFREIEKLLSA